MGIIDRVLELLSESGRSQKDLTDYLGIKKSVFSGWKKGTSQSYNKYLPRIAEFFKVSVDWLTGDTRFRTAKELIQCCDSWEIGGNEYFDPPYDFCGLIKEKCTEGDVTIEELANEIGLTPEQYERCEAGYEPISYDQAKLLCEYFDTTIKQLLFDHALYEPEYPVPERDLDDIESFEKRCEDAAREAKASLYPDRTQFSPEENAQALLRGIQKLSAKDRQLLLNMARLLFGQDFGNGS